MAEAGRHEILTDDLTLSIRSFVLAGISYKEIQEKLSIHSETWDGWVWRDYKGFRKDLNSWKAERLVKKSEKLSEDILDAIHLKEDGKIDTDILRVKQKEAEFVRSTLGKNEGYSTRTEQTGAGGGAQKMEITWGDNEHANTESSNSLQSESITEDDSPIDEEVERDSSAS